EAGDPGSRFDPPEDGAPPGADPVAWLDDRAAVLVELLNRLGPDEPCWNWAGDEFESGWVARRMALETAVHRYDGELAAGEPTQIKRELAADGIDERVEVHLKADVPDYPEASLGGSICLSCTDVDAAWVVDVGGGRLRVREGAGPAAAVARGTASDLFLFSWNRLGSDALEVTGDRSIPERWSTLPA
ncbi:MAG: maleylpyruvate isomerase N-terminal domain-containing protein, partial [Acidimicrobiales bacterium]